MGKIKGKPVRLGNGEEETKVIVQRQRDENKWKVRG